MKKGRNMKLSNRQIFLLWVIGVCVSVHFLTFPIFIVPDLIFGALTIFSFRNQASLNRDFIIYTLAILIAWIFVSFLISYDNLDIWWMPHYSSYGGGFLSGGL